MKYELKPCPFCGESATLYFTTDSHHSPFVQCDGAVQINHTPKCFGTQYPWIFKTAEEAVAAWNRRVTEYKWISVNDALPKEDGEYLVLYGGKKAGIRLFLNGTFRLNYETAKSYKTLTHWATLPKFPAEDGR